jgi:hypothetical protein
LSKSANKNNENVIKTEKLAIVIQFPNFVRSTDLKAGYGKVRYDESTKVCRWEIGSLPLNMSGDKLELRGRIAIHELQTDSSSSSSGGSGSSSSSSSSGVRSPSSSIVSPGGGMVKKNDVPVHYSSIPMQVEFSIPKSNVSGLKLSNINITNVKYKAQKMSRLHTRSGAYEMRL